MSARNNEYFRENNKKTYQLIRSKVIDGYGGKCNRCGFTDPRALQVDHVNGGGTQETANRWKGSVRSFLYWLVNNNFPDGYQLLCANCNSIKRIENQEFGSKYKI